jgi:hypothetical protein
MTQACSLGHADIGLDLNTSAEEISRIQRCISDLISLLALPAVWSGREPSRILEILLDALLLMPPWIRLTNAMDSICINAS